MKPPLKNKRLPAFTIIEMIIVMLLSAIVVGLTYLYFNQFSYYIRHTGQSSDTYLTFSQFCFVFEKDMNDASEVFFQSPDRLKMIKDETEINYQLDEEFAIREIETGTDTFRFHIVDPDILTMEKYNSLVLQIGFDALLADSNSVEFFYVKEYPAAVLFKHFEHEK